MITHKDQFLRYLAQTSPFPISLEIERADGCFLYATDGRRYYDLISGFSVTNIGHNNGEVIQAITDQAGKYLHTIGYGEFILSPQVEYAKTLSELLPQGLDQVFFVNSGSEAVEGALKLAKRVTGRNEIISCHQSYHGSTHGALSVMGSEIYKQAFRPLLPGIFHIPFGKSDALESINQKTAAVILEPIQAEAGIIEPPDNYLNQVRERCKEVGALLIFDEIQTGFGRTGSLFAMDHFGVVPDILVLGKALGGGMPLGAFVASLEYMNTLTYDPPLGHITTFGGHPVSCAAGLASARFIVKQNLAAAAVGKGRWLKQNLGHPLIKEIRGQGLFLAAELKSEDVVTRFFHECNEEGLIFDYFLFCKNAIRITPPLIINQPELEDLTERILRTLNRIR